MFSMKNRLLSNVLDGAKAGLRFEISELHENEYTQPNIDIITALSTI